MANITKPDRSGEPVLIPKMHAERDIERQRLLTIPEEVGDVQSGFSPPDRGKDAWLVLVAAFILEALVWGFPFAFGVFQNYYSTHPQFSSASSGSTLPIAAIGTTAIGLMMIAAPFVYVVLRRFPHHRKHSAVLGFPILLASLIGASFANTIPQLFLTQGVLYSIGGSIHYYPVFLYLDEWFVARKGFAYGVVWAGASTSGVIIPLLMEWLLEKYGFRIALRVWALMSTVLTVPALWVLKGRLPPDYSIENSKVELGFLKSSAFWILETANFFQALGYYMPSVYLPSFTRSVGLTALTGTIAVSVMNAANTIGAIITGILTDRYGVTTAINVCAFGTVAAIFLFWTFATYTPMLFLFAVLYGVFAGGFASTWSGVVDPVRKIYPATDTGMIVSLFAAGKGVASIISGPLSGVLMRNDIWKDHARFAFGSGYGYLIVFSGVTAALSLIGWCGKKCGLV